jgi:predicted nucleic acid-binding protein
LFCADSSCWVRYLASQTGDDVELIDAHLKSESLVMCPVVLAELFSDPLRSVQAKKSLLTLLLLLPGFWERAGLTRAELLKHEIKPKLGDTLIAQVCIDHNITLHSRDADFRPFAKYAGLQLVLHGLVH